MTIDEEDKIPIEIRTNLDEDSFKVLPEDYVDADDQKVVKPIKKDNLSEIDWKDQYARVLADFDNYKKRVARDKATAYDSLEANILEDFLPVIDNMKLALDNYKGALNPSFKEGMRMIYDLLVSKLASHGATPLENCIGKTPDPNLHEVIATLPNGRHKPGTIEYVTQMGWMHNGKLLRAAKVVVNN